MINLELSKMRVLTLKNLGFLLEETNWVHESGICIAYFEIQILPEFQFLDILNKAFSDKKEKCGTCVRYSRKGNYFVCKDCGVREKALKY